MADSGEEHASDSDVEALMKRALDAARLVGYANVKIRCPKCRLPFVGATFEAHVRQEHAETLP